MPRVSAYRLKHVARVYAKEENAAVSFEEILSHADIGADVLTDQNARVELIAEAAAVERACDVLDDPTFAARTGLSTPGAKTLLAYLARASETVGQVLEFARRYYTLEDPHLQFHAFETDNGPVVALKSEVLAGNQSPRYWELLAFGMFMRIRQIAGPELGALGVILETTDADHCRQLSEIAGCEVASGQQMCGVRLPVGGLDFPIPTSDAALVDHLTAHGDARLESMPREVESLSSKVIALVRSQLPGHLPSGDEVAEKLFMTRRTLTRHLAAEGTTYKALAEGARCELAKRLLVGEGSIAQVAFLLDFADQAAFSVAFKRWTGTTPAQFKKSNV